MFKKVNFRKSMFWAFLVFGAIETFRLIAAPFFAHYRIQELYGRDLSAFELIELMFPENFQMLLAALAYFAIAWFLYVPYVKKTA